jgi:hypothetical protein
MAINIQKFNWDWWIRMANFGELFLAVLTLIFTRKRRIRPGTRH